MSLEPSDIWRFFRTHNTITELEAFLQESKIAPQTAFFHAINASNTYLAKYLWRFYDVEPPRIEELDSDRDQYPFLRYLVDLKAYNPLDILELAAGNGDLDFIKKYIGQTTQEQKQDIIKKYIGQTTQEQKQNIFRDALWWSQMDVVKYLVENQYITYLRDDDIEAALQNIETLDYITSLNVQITNPYHFRELTALLINLDNVDTYQKYFNIYPQINLLLLELKEDLKRYLFYYLKEKYQFEDIFSNPPQTLEEARQFLKAGVPIDKRTLNVAIATTKMDFVKFLVEELLFPITEKNIEFAIDEDIPQILTYLISHRGILTEVKEIKKHEWENEKEYTQRLTNIKQAIQIGQDNWQKRHTLLKEYMIDDLVGIIEGYL